MRTPAQHAELAERNRERRLEIVRRNKKELIDRAREQGIAVDLDQLVALNIEEEDAAEQLPEKLAVSRQNSGSSFDDMIGADGKLKPETGTSEMAERPAASTTSFNPVSDDGLRQRGAGVRGFTAGSAFANPFDDDAHVLYDQEATTDAPTVRSVSPRPVIEPHILDEQVQSHIVNVPITETESAETETQYKTEDELEAEIQEAIRRSLADDQEAIRRSLADVPPLIDFQDSLASSNTLQHSAAKSPSSIADSLYDPPSPRRAPASLSDSLYDSPSPRPMTNSSTIPAFSESSSFHSAGSEPMDIDADADGERTPSGALTPTDDGFSTISSAVGHVAPDIAVLEDLEELSVPQVRNVARSEATNDSFSVIDATTPLSWTDVDSDSETEAANGESHVVRR